MRNGFGLVLTGVVVQGLIVLLYYGYGGSLPTPPASQHQHYETNGRLVAPPVSIDFEPHKLRLDWTNLDDDVRSPLARRFQAHQSDCRLPTADFRFRNRYGLGSDLHVWTQALCNAVQRNVRIHTDLPWMYVDETSCAAPNVTSASPADSALACYFPSAEPGCPGDGKDEGDTGRTASADRPKLYRGNGMVTRGECDDVRERHGNATFAAVRASGVEFLFSSVSPVVVREAEAQLRALFGGGGATNSSSSSSTTTTTTSLPTILVTVHIRWGDKRREDRPRPVGEYVDAVQRLLKEQSSDRGTNAEGTAVGIFLATEDPAAVEQFQREADKHGWQVFVDMYFQEFSDVRDGTYNGNPRMAQSLKGRPGLVALASLLVALQANDFVLTTTSNWSRLLNELRKNVLDPRCGNCTRMVDLSPGEW